MIKMPCSVLKRSITIRASAEDGEESLDPDVVGLRFSGLLVRHAHLREDRDCDNGRGGET